MSSLRIAFLLSHFPSLCETFVLNRITGLLKRGHEVTIIAYGPSVDSKVHPDIANFDLLKRTRYLDIPESRWRRLFSFPASFLRGLRDSRFKTMCRSLDFFHYGKEALSLRLYYGARSLPRNSAFDIIHSHHGPNGLRDTYYRQMGAISGAHVTSFHGADATRHPRLYGTDVYKRLFEKADRMLAVSEGIERRLLELGCPKSKVRVHRTGVDCRKFAFQINPRKKSEPLKILSIGRLVEKKGFRYGIAAVAELLKKGLNLDYDIVGEGPERQILRQAIHDAGATDRIRLVGPKDQGEILEMFRSHEVLIAPSVRAGDGNEEGIPNVLKEAMAAGLPVVATRSGDISELIQNGVNGLLVEPSDSHDLGQAIQRLYDDSAIWAPMAEKARQSILERYDTEKLADELIAIYRELL